MKPGPTVFVVDEDSTTRDTIGRCCASANLSLELFNSADEFLAAYEPHREGCLITEASPPMRRGLDLQARLAKLGYSIPIIILTSPGDLTGAVAAMKAGAFSVVGKPFNEQPMIETIREAMDTDSVIRLHQANIAQIKERIARLTLRQRQVLDFLVRGKTSKEIAAKLGLSRKTIDLHRGHVMAKMLAETVADLIRMITTIGN